MLIHEALKAIRIETLYIHMEYGSLIVGGFSEWSVSIEDEDRKHASYRNHSSYPRVKDGALPRI